MFTTSDIQKLFFFVVVQHRKQNLKKEAQKREFRNLKLFKRKRKNMVLLVILILKYWEILGNKNIYMRKI